MISISAFFQETKDDIEVADSCAIIFYALIAMDVPLEPTKVSTRVLILSVCITGAFLFWSYSAGLVSFLTVDKFDFPIKSLHVGIFTLPNWLFTK